MAQIKKTDKCVTVMTPITTTNVKITAFDTVDLWETNIVFE